MEPVQNRSSKVNDNCPQGPEKAKITTLIKRSKLKLGFTEFCLVSKVALTRTCMWVYTCLLP